MYELTLIIRMVEQHIVPDIVSHVVPADGTVDLLLMMGLLIVIIIPQALIQNRQELQPIHIPLVAPQNFTLLSSNVIFLIVVKHLGSQQLQIMY